MTWRANTFLMILPLYLPLMELYIISLALTLLNKIMLLKENIVILLKLQDHCCYLLVFQVSSWVKLFLQQLMLWIGSRLHIILVSLLLKKNVWSCTWLLYFACFWMYSHVKRTKLSTKFTLCVFLGYGLGQKGYCCLDPVSQKLYVSHHVVVL